MESLQEKLLKLKENIKARGSLALGFSGGVDSVFLAAVCREVLGERLLLVMVTSPFLPATEADFARAWAAGQGMALQEAEAAVLNIPEVRSNSRERCYYCKRQLFTLVKEKAAAQGLNCVADGSNADDAKVFRPGRRALRELGIVSPLEEAGLGKDEIRSLSRAKGLVTFNKPSMACLASRFPYDEELTRAGLRRVERAEEFLRGLGFSQLRVRSQGELARIEVLPEEMGTVLEPANREKIGEYLRGLGFCFVTLDLAGFVSGSYDLPR